jgi:hypothetical protein
MDPLSTEAFHEGAVSALRVALVELAKTGHHGESVESALISALTQLYTDIMPKDYHHDAGERLQGMMREVNSLINL